MLKLIHRTTLLCFLVLACAPAFAQTTWNGHWVTHPDVGPQEQAVVLFRTDFELETLPDSFPIAITADNHFRLYVNGQYVATGPQLGEITHWRYDRHDLRKYLVAGSNTLAVEVINWGHYRMFGIQSVHTALNVNGVGPAEIVTTDGYAGNYRTFINRGIRAHQVKWRTGNNDIIGGLYANNPTDSLLADRYPWGWEQPSFTTADWPAAPFLERGHLAADGSGFLWLLEPRTTPPQTHERQPFRALRIANELEIPPDWLAGDKPLQLPANGTYRLLLDLEEVTVAHPVIRWAAGKGADVKLTWAENLFTPEGKKVHRDRVGGLVAKGYFDVIRPNGGAEVRSYVPTWYRTFRYLDIVVTTGGDPLNLYAPVPRSVRSSIPVRARFSSDHAGLNEAFAISRRTAVICTQDYFLSDAYYETMQYIGDTKVHALAWQALTGDFRHTRNALLDFHRSRNEDGVLKSCYPLRYNFYHSSYSLIWIDMVEDYYLATRDEELVREVLPGIRQTLAFFGRHHDQVSGFLKDIPYKPFVDWYVDNGRGWAKGSDHNASVPITLQYAHALQSAARLLQELRIDKPLADRYRQRQFFINDRMRACCLDPARGLLAERPSRDYFDQHSQALGLLTGALPGAGAQDAADGIVEAMLGDPDLAPATYYFRYYLFEALQRTGRQDLTLRAMQPWFDLADQGLTTVVERFEGVKPTRSEAHPWGASPVVFAFRNIAGIDLEHLGEHIMVEPRLGELRHIEGYSPSFGPDRGVTFSIDREGDRTTGSVTAQELPLLLRVNGQSIEVAAGTTFSW